MPDDDWRSPTAYDYVSEMSAAGFAFEFLRRNVDYRNDFRNFEGTDASGARSEAVPIRPDLRWGLSFLGGSGDSGGPTAGLLVTERACLGSHFGARCRFAIPVGSSSIA
jgi:hypothetical protein